MNFSPPVWARDAAEEALRSVEGNHYSPAKGRLRLRKAIKEFYGTQFGKELDHETEIVVTSGANEGGLCLIAIRIVPSSHGRPLLTPFSRARFELCLCLYAECFVVQDNTPRSPRSSSWETM